MCKDCKISCDIPIYQKNMIIAISYFLNGVKEKNETFLDVIENPSKSSLFDETVKIEAMYDHNGFDVTKTGSFCLRNTK